MYVDTFTVEANPTPCLSTKSNFKVKNPKFEPFRPWHKYSFRGPQKQESKNNQSFAIFGQNMNYIRNDVVMINITF